MSLRSVTWIWGPTVSPKQTLGEKYNEEEFQEWPVPRGPGEGLSEGSRLGLGGFAPQHPCCLWECRLLPGQKVEAAALGAERRCRHHVGGPAGTMPLAFLVSCSGETSLSCSLPTSSLGAPRSCQEIPCLFKGSSWFLLFSAKEVVSSVEPSRVPSPPRASWQEGDGLAFLHLNITRGVEGPPASPGLCCLEIPGPASPGVRQRQSTTALCDSSCRRHAPTMCGIPSRFILGGRVMVLFKLLQTTCPLIRMM